MTNASGTSRYGTDKCWRANDYVSASFWQKSLEPFLRSWKLERTRPEYWWIAGKRSRSKVPIGKPDNNGRGRVFERKSSWKIYKWNTLIMLWWSHIWPTNRSDKRFSATRRNNIEEIEQIRSTWADRGKRVDVLIAGLKMTHIDEHRGMGLPPKNQNCIRNAIITVNFFVLFSLLLTICPSKKKNFTKYPPIMAKTERRRVIAYYLQVHTHTFEEVKIVTWYMCVSHKTRLTNSNSVLTI